MHNDYVPQIVAGVGINVPEDVSAGRFRRKVALDDPFILYVGRIDGSKNVPELIDYFVRFRAETGRNVKLLLIGKSNIELPEHPDLMSLGFVSEADKFDAIRAADVLVMPSLYESLSLVAMEAWLMETPTLVNGNCKVLKQQTRSSNGGLYYYTYDEFSTALQLLLDDVGLRRQLGRQGRSFVAANYEWELVMAKFTAVLDTLTGERQDHHA